jgi:enamine deaminase RidA (YjgF/YER057c/UK114 family)
LFEKNIKDLGLIISEPTAAIANYVPFKVIDNLVYISGQAPIQNGKVIFAGKIGNEVSENDGILAAKLCCLNIIAALRKSINGDWDKFDSFVKLGGFVNCNDDYTNHPKIINGASDLLVSIFGDQGRHTRFAVGTNSLPMNISV